MADAPAPESFPAIHPETGALVEIPAAYVQQAIQQGFTAPSPEQAQFWAAKKHYGAPGQQAITALEGVGRGIAGPAFDLTAQGLGLTSPAEQLGRKEENPKIETTGQVGGFIIPTIATLGASAPEQVAVRSGLRSVAGATLPGLAERAGAAVARAVTGEGTGLLARAAPTAANLATQGAIISAADVGTQAALEDPKLTAQSAAVHIVGGAMMGGALGFAGSAVAKAVPDGIGAKLEGWLGDVAGERANKAAGAIQGDLNRALKRMSREDLNALGQRAVENGWVGPLSTPAQTFEKTAAAMEDVGGKMGEFIDAATASPKAPTFDWDNIRKGINEEVLDPLRKKASELPAVKQAEAVLENFSQVYGERPLTLADVHGIRRDLDAVIYQHGKSLDPFAKAVARPLKGVRDLLTDRLSAGIDEAGMASSGWRALNSAYRDAKVINGFAEKGMLRSEGNNLLSLTETMGGIAGAASDGLSGGIVGSLGAAALRRHSSGTIAFAATEAQKLFASLAGKVDGGIAAGVGRIFGEAAAKGGAEVSERVVNPSNYRTIAQGLREHAGDPERMAETTSSQTATIKRHDPEVGAELDAVAARSVQHLASLLPKETPPGPFSAPYQPSAAELASFNRAASVIRNPALIPHLIAEGKIHPDHVAALGAVYPSIQREMSMQIMDKMAQLTARGGSIPFKARMGLALFMGGNMDPMLSQASMQANQASLAMARRDEQTGNVEPSSRSTANLGVAGRMATPMQASAARSA